MNSVLCGTGFRHDDGFFFLFENLPSHWGKVHLGEKAEPWEGTTLENLGGATAPPKFWGWSVLYNVFWGPPPKFRVWKLSPPEFRGYGLIGLVKDRKKKQTQLFVAENGPRGTLFDPQNPPEKSLCGSPFWVLFQEMRNIKINFFLAAQNGGFWAGTKKRLCCRCRCRHCRHSHCRYSSRQRGSLHSSMLERCMSARRNLAVKSGGIGCTRREPYSAKGQVSAF